MEDKQFQHLRVKECIYKGNGREVLLCEHRETKEQLIAKRVQRHSLSEKEMNDFIREASIMQSLKHPNIISFKNVFKTESEIIIGMYIKVIEFN